VTRSSAQWHEAVATAAVAGDQVALRRLYLEAEELFGADASTTWAEAMSALDASAQTG
jgi:hypothetical protein